MLLYLTLYHFTCPFSFNIALSFYRERSCDTAQIPSCTEATDNVFNYVGSALQSPLQYSGSASYNSYMINLAANARGSAYVKTPVKVVDNWEANFKFQVSGGSGSAKYNGGFAFVLQPNGASNNYATSSCNVLKSIKFVDGFASNLVNLDTEISCRYNAD